MYNINTERESPLQVRFYETQMKNQPCRDFLLELNKEDRQEVGADIFSVQKGFPLGLPLCRKITKDLWEIRSDISDGICPVFFTVFDNTIVLLHGFIKKSQRIPLEELEIAKSRLSSFKEQNK